MDIREIFERAYSNAYEKYPFSDTQTAMSKIMGKAEKMRNENITRINAKELPAPVTEKKHSRAPMIGGIAAGVAAALGVGFFAGSITNGGITITPLKEGGAAYSAVEDIVTEEFTAEQDTEPKQSEEEIYDAQDIIDGITEDLSAKTDAEFGEDYSEAGAYITLERDENGGSVYSTYLKAWNVTKTQITLVFRDPRLTRSNTGLIEAIQNANVELEMRNGDKVTGTFAKSEFDRLGQHFFVTYDLSEEINIPNMTDLTVGNSAVWGERISAHLKRMEERDIKTSTLYTASEEGFRHENYQVQITGYTFDGINLRLAYDIILDEDSGYVTSDFFGPADEDGNCAIDPVSLNVDTENGFLSGGTTYYPDDPFVLHTEWDLHLYEPSDEIDINFTPHDLIRGRNLSSVTGDVFTFTAKIPENVPIRTIAPENTFATDSFGNTYAVDVMKISGREISAVLSGIPYTQFNYEPAETIMEDLSSYSVRLFFEDGRELIIPRNYSLGQPFADGKTYIHYALTEEIDPDTVTAVYLNNDKIY